MTPRKRGPLGKLLVAAIVLGVLLALICGGAPGSFAPLPRELEDLRGHLVLLGVAMSIALVTALAFLPAIAARGQDLDFYTDAVAAPRGWVVADEGFFFRRLTGSLAGRKVALVASMGRHSPYANPGQLRLYLSATTGRRMQLTTPAHGALIADLGRGLDLLNLREHPEVVGLAGDPAGVRALLAWPEVKAALQRLLAQPPGNSPLFRVEPDAVCLTLAGPDAHRWTPEQLDAWLADLAVLAEGLETVGAPRPPEAPWPAEQELQHNPRRQRLKATLGCGGCLTLAGLAWLGSALAIALSKLL